MQVAHEVSHAIHVPSYIILVLALSILHSLEQVPSSTDKYKLLLQDVQKLVVEEQDEHYDSQIIHVFADKIVTPV